MDSVQTLDKAGEISAAAATVLRGRGYASVGVDEIAAASGLTGPALYRYFDGKHEVLVDVVSRFVRRLAALPVDVTPGELARVVAANPDAASVSVRQLGLIEPAIARELLESPNVRALLPVADSMSVTQRVRLRALYGAAIHLGLKRGLSERARERAATRCADVFWQVPIELGPYQPRPPRRLLPASRREAVMAVATDLFSRHGYGGVALRDIGDELGVTASAVSKHFASKEQVLIALFDRASHQIAAALQAALRSATDPMDALGRSLRGYSNLAVDSRELIMIYSSERNSLSGDGRQDRRARQLGYVAEVRHLLEMIDPELSRAAAQVRATAMFSAINEVLFDEHACGHRDLAAALTALGMCAAIGPMTAKPDGTVLDGAVGRTVVDGAGVTEQS